MALSISTNDFWPPRAIPIAHAAGLRTDAGGTHTSRTIMLDELASVLEFLPTDATSDDFSDAIIEQNCLGKTTTATRRSSRKRLSELYGLDPELRAFRVLRRLWTLDVASRPLLAILLALGRDPLLLATASIVLPLSQDEELPRLRLREVLRTATQERLNEATLDKVARNVASSWTQSGHLRGRTFKARTLVAATPVSVVYALFLANAAGFLGREMLSSGWVRVLDASAASAQECAVEAKRMGLIELRSVGDVFDLGFGPLEQASGATMGGVNGRH